MNWLLYHRTLVLLNIWINDWLDRISSQYRLNWFGSNYRLYWLRLRYVLLLALQRLLLIDNWLEVLDWVVSVVLIRHVFFLLCRLHPLSHLEQVREVICLQPLRTFLCEGRGDPLNYPSIELCFLFNMV